VKGQHDIDDQQRAVLKSRLADVHASFEQAEQSIVLRHTCRMEQPSAGYTPSGGQREPQRGRKQAALASFLTWCCRQDLLPADPMAKLERISVPERAPRGVPPTVVARVLDTIPKRNLRDRVLFGVIAATGLRAAEALGIYVTDLELARDDEHLTVRGKGGRTRTVYRVVPAALAQLAAVLGPAELIAPTALTSEALA